MDAKVEKLLEEEFRNHVSNTDAEGNRLWIYARIVKGKFYKYRSQFSWLLLAMLFAFPFIKVNGNQFFMFNIIERRFNFFGIQFYPQDFHLVALGMLITLVFIALFTALFGRVWCGWACPQTIFMEMVFRKIENWVEGDYRAQKRLDDAPWNWDKISKKGFKHFIFFTISFLIANTFLAYIIGSDTLFQIILDNPSNHLGGLAFLIVFTFVFYFVFAKFRENVCTVVCPYGRLQSSLIDKRSLIVGYDSVRGEPRGKKSKKENETHGDCIDCKICVQVCPTGIDIRDGLQMECVACTACIDACDDVMEKIHRPKGLIRYTSLENLQGVKSKLVNLRNVAYSAVLVLLLGIFAILLLNRGDIEATVLRTPGLTFKEDNRGFINNLYSYSVLNKTNKTLDFQLEISGIADTDVNWVGSKPTLEPGKLSEGIVMISVPKSEIQQLSTEIQLTFVSTDGEKILDKVNTSFIGPNQRKK
ncbi:cytochrome c oxidase accessory protein CcoG [Marinilongibacter aquaticus]|uniref:cytochrome c oxidase accessory protein CcoG n=1 Tax=Marinilongibacter aquaticus TaxID=2975157 RepID=UPI0021BD3BF3|nr:cytochrome c oxidase accessory protein CcoG [Marinilongibacter aquaticus]UBM58550.1 cytochrome c oxidase accessory protein CcoG [Marinilongibacter aquaticus]